MTEDSTLEKNQQETFLNQFIKQECDDSTLPLPLPPSPPLTSCTHDNELILKKLLEPGQEEPTVKQEETSNNTLVQDTVAEKSNQKIVDQPDSIPNTDTTAIPATTSTSDATTAVITSNTTTTTAAAAAAATTTTTATTAATVTTTLSQPTITTELSSSTSLEPNNNNSNNNNNNSNNNNSNSNNTSIDTSHQTIPPVTSITTFEEIQRQLKSTLDHVEQRSMVSAFETLSNATSAVVEHCQELGLTSDDHPYNAIDREQFWAGLNNCWLYALAQQRHEPSQPIERLTDQHLYSLRDKVVSWADTLERFGLVDYEMGWWEADILSAIDGILAMNYAAAQAAAQAVVAQAAAVLFGGGGGSGGGSGGGVGGGIGGGVGGSSGGGGGGGSSSEDVNM